MGLRDDLVKRIERKQQEIMELESRLKENAAYLQALEDTLKLLPREGINEGNADAVLRQNSGTARAREAILQAGRALHVSELLKAIGRDDTRNSRAGLSGSLAAYVRKGEIFTRPAPNTFGLLELKEPENERVPPPGFGRDE